MAQQGNKMPGGEFGAVGATFGGVVVARMLPEAYGGTAGLMGRLVLLAKPRPDGSGSYPPFAVVRLQELPEDIRRQVAVGGGAQPPRAAAPVMPPKGLRLQLAAMPKEGAGGGAVGTYSDRRILRLKAAEDGGKVVVRLDDHDASSTLQVLGDDAAAAAAAELGKFYDNKGVTAPDDDGDLPIVALLLHSDHVTEPGEHAVPFVGNGHGAEQGGHYCDGGVLTPSPKNLVPGVDATYYSVQVFDDEAESKDDEGAVVAAPVRGGGGGGGLGGLGLAAASVAVAGLIAGGGAATTAGAFGLFAVQIGGVALVTMRVFRA